AAVVAFQEGQSADIGEATQELANQVWSPLVPGLDDVDTLYIAPDGPLCFLSFAALPGRKAGTFALEDYQISYVNSGRWLYRQLQDARPPEGEGLLLCGDIRYRRPDAGAQPRSRSRDPLLPEPTAWTNLAATALEIDQIQSIWDGAESRASPTRKL